jgi:MFS family permease
MGSVLGIAGGAIAAEVLGAYAAPTGYSVLFALALSGLMISYLFLITLREPAAPPARGEPPVSHRMRTLQILRSNHNLRRFLVADALQISANMGIAFFAVHALSRFALSDASAGTFTAIMMGSMIAGSLVFGPLADRRGHKVNLMVAATATLVGSVVALVAPTPLVYSIVFVGAALSTGLVNISRLPMIAELAGESDRSAVIAVTNMCTSPFVFWGILGGVIADAAGYEWVFLLAALFALAGLLWLALMVTEPRQGLPNRSLTGGVDA